MRLIAGLGNPEKDYKGTRHNVGFETINKLAWDFDIAMNKIKFSAQMGDGRIGGVRTLLIKPQTYMNMSGCAVRDVMRYFDIPPQDIIVVYDDADMPLGRIRIREKGGAGSHNGMKSVIYQLETEDFPRVRIGIGAKPPQWDMADYVLSRFAPEETELIIAGITKAADAVEAILRDGVKNAMNRFNRQEPEGLE